MRTRAQKAPAQWKAVALAAFAVVVLIGASAASRGDASLEARAVGIDRQLRCPTCQGLSIADSPATSAARMRALVREQLAAGASDDDVRGFFVARYGRWILLDPPLAGVDLALWLAPAAFILAGALLVVARSRGRGSEQPDRRWRRALPGVSRMGGSVVAIAAVTALVAPIAFALAPRFAGQEATGRPAGGGGPGTLAELEAAVRVDPDDPGTRLALAEGLLEAGRPAEAAQWFRATLELEPGSYRALLGLGAILLESGRPDGAFAAFDRVLEIDPDQPDALLFRAVSRLTIDGGVSAAVRADLESFLRVAPAADSRRAMVVSLLEGGVPVANP